MSTTTTKRYLTDTNVLVKLLRKDQTTEQRLRALSNVYVCSHVAGELYAGAYKSQHVDKNVAEVEAIFQTLQFVKCDNEVAKSFGQLKQGLLLKGKMIPVNDLWIAATAVCHDLTLITFDAHFDLIDNLTKERW